jgi:hypothetical protein
MPPKIEGSFLFNKNDCIPDASRNTTESEIPAAPTKSSRQILIFKFLKREKA